MCGFVLFPFGPLAKSFLHKSFFPTTIALSWVEQCEPLSRDHCNVQPLNPAAEVLDWLLKMDLI
jgi:hypothetical protein